tara:strand:+ start:74 stop:682 length:609 start_codon:yes stop_codon:yes gene_type:complete
MNNNTTKSNPCTDILSDLEYLEHMVPHHQVAVDMSNMLIPHITNPTILHLCRNIIRKQEYEITEMNTIKKNIGNTIFDSKKPLFNKNNKNNYNKTKLSLYEPIKSKDKDGECDPLFFKPNDHAKHMEHMKITIRSYLEHMIPHHQVAVDMSKRLLLHTNHSYLIDFCRKLILDQQYEILSMNDLLDNTYIHESELLKNHSFN